MKITSAFLVALLCAACRSGTAPAPYAKVSVTVDSAVYHLRPVQTWYTIRLTATIANNSGHDVYLSRFCPSTSLARPKGYSVQLWLGQYACSTGASSPPPTLTLSPGSSHTESLTLQGDEQPQAYPQITMENLTGPAVFGFLVSTDLRRFEPVLSPPFVLQSPE